MKNEIRTRAKRKKEKKKKNNDFKLDFYKIDGTLYSSISLVSIDITRKSDGFCIVLLFAIMILLVSFARQ